MKYYQKKINVGKDFHHDSASLQVSGEAIYIDDIYGYRTNAEMFEYIKDNLEFDQLIWEFGNEDNPDWLHISYVDREKNRSRILKAVRDQGKVKYINIT